MFCKNCGAEYEAEELHCPYCHAENKEAADKKKKEILEKYDMEAEQMKTQAEQYPREEARKRTNRILRGVGILLFLIVVLTIVMPVYTKISVNHAYEEQLVHTEKLEQLFVAEDYAGLKAYMTEHELTGFEKHFKFR